MRDYLIYFSGKPYDTFFKHILRLPPAHFLKAVKEKFFIKKYFQFDHSQAARNFSSEEFAYEFKKIFFNAIDSLSTRNDLIYGTALSGGLDSSAITSSLAHLNKNIKSQTIIFEGLNDADKRLACEEEYANSVIKMHKINYDFIKIKNTGCMSYLAELTETNDEPASLINGYIHLNIFKNLSKQGITNFFDGFDGDTAISHGYEHFFELGRKFKFKKLRDEYKYFNLKNGIKNPNYFSAFKNYVVKPLIPQNLWWIYKSISSNKIVPINWYNQLDKNKFTPPDFKEVICHYGMLPIPNLYVKNSNYCHYLDINNRNIEMSLNLINQAASNYNIDIKFPFFDRDLLQFCISMPSSQKLHNGTSRYI